MIHELKIKSEYYEQVKKGLKNFEIRKNDRNYQVGDILNLREINENGDYTGAYLKKKIGYMLKDCPEYGLQDGYCILSLISPWEVLQKMNIMKKYKEI